MRHQREHAAVDVDVLAGDVAGRVRGEIPAQLGELVGLSLAVCRRMRDEELAHRLPVRIELRIAPDPEAAGHDRVRRDAEMRVLDGDCAAQAHQSGLRDGDVRAFEPAVHRVEAGDVDDPAPPALDHGGKHCAAAAHCSEQVDGEHLLPLRLRQVEECADRPVRGVVDQDVDRADASCCRLGQRACDRFARRKLDLERPGRKPCVGELLDERLGLLSSRAGTRRARCRRRVRTARP